MTYRLLNIHSRPNLQRCCTGKSKCAHFDRHDTLCNFFLQQQLFHKYFNEFFWLSADKYDALPRWWSNHLFRGGSNVFLVRKVRLPCSSELCPRLGLLALAAHYGIWKQDIWCSQLSSQLSQESLGFLAFVIQSAPAVSCFLQSAWRLSAVHELAVMKWS